MLWTLIGFIAISLSVEFLANCYLVVHINGIYMYASSVQIIQKSNVLAAMNGFTAFQSKASCYRGINILFLSSAPKAMN
jgi:hypothetical protein